MSCGIAFVSLAFMTLYLCFCFCVYKLHYTTSNITNDNKHLAKKKIRRKATNIQNNKQNEEKEEKNNETI